MRILGANLNVILLGSMAVACSLGFSGCGKSDDGKSKKLPEDAQAEGRVDDQRGDKLKSEFLPFRLAFKADGTPVILDDKGNVEVWDKAKLPLETSGVYSLQSFSIAFVQGSCTVLVTNIDGSLSLKRYPSYYCKAKGIPET